MLNIKNLTEEIKNLGISAATVFPVGEIKFDDIFRKMCRDNLCGRYGKNYKCPPAVGEPEELKNEVLTYDYAILIQTIHPLEDSFDFEGMGEGGKIHAKNIENASEYIKANLNPEKMLALGAGGCGLCEKCGAAENGAPCRFPDRAISSVEAYCMDVAHMTTSHGLNYINGENTVSYVAVFLVA